MGRRVKIARLCTPTLAVLLACSPAGCATLRSVSPAEAEGRTGDDSPDAETGRRLEDWPMMPADCPAGGFSEVDW